MLAKPAVALALVSFALSAAPDPGDLFIQSYSPKTYGASLQNWAIAQDRNGVMYFGNTDGLLIYDGVTWRKLRIGNGVTVRSLAEGPDGTIYVGAEGDIGYLRPNASGAIEYVSLLSSLSAKDRKFGAVWSTLAAPDGIYFASYQKLFRCSAQSDTAKTGIKVWTPESRFGRVFWIDGALYLPVQNRGLERLQNDALTLVPGGDRFADQDLRAVFADHGALLAVTRDGLYRQNGDKFEPVKTDAANLLRDAKIFTALRLPSGDLALGTRTAGLILLDPANQLKRVVGKPAGLANEYVNAIFSDREGGIWVALEYGLARIDPALSQFDERSGLQGNVYSIARSGDTLYAGSSVGLFAFEKGRFEAVPGFKSRVFVLLNSPAGLLSGGESGLYRLQSGQAVQILNRVTVWDLLLAAHDPSTLYVAAERAGLFRYRWDGKTWQKQQQITDDDREFRSLAEDADGRIWVATRTSIDRIDPSANPPKIEHFDEPQGVPAGFKTAYKIDGRIYFATANGLLKFDPQKRAFVPDPSLGAMFADGTHGVSLMREDSQGNIWIGGDGYHGILRKRAGGYDWTPMPLLRAGIGEMYAFMPGENGVVWAAGVDGWMVRYDPSARPPADSRPDFRVLLRRVYASDKPTPVYDGGQEPQSAMRLTHEDNGLRFEYAAPFFEDSSAVQYQTRLTGLDRDWSAWTPETRRDYTNLFEGGYTFEVRARNPHGQVSPLAQFPFRVLAPWYRTLWAYLLYALAAAAGIWGLVRWRVAALRAQNVQLEEMVHERTIEIRHQRDQIQAEEHKTKALLLNILPSSVAEELRATGSVEPTVFTDTTVLFTDFVGFTLSSERVEAHILVAALHQYFTAFDEIVGRYGLEKLKTIGDAYMCAAGLPKHRRSHAVDAVMAALEMVEAVARLRQQEHLMSWKVRVGLNSGPVTAGVVGVRKFAYDIWGPTVNLASRMESAGSPDRVNLSPATYALVKDFIDCEPRGLVHTKEGRLLDMYFASGVHPNLHDPEKFAERYRTVFGEAPRVVPAEKPLTRSGSQHP